MRTQIIDKKLEKILEERGELHKLVGELNETIVRADKERTKLGYKMDKLKEKTKVIMDKLNIQLGEFEVISRVYAEEGRAYYEVIDMVEEYKKTIREKNAK